MGKPIEENVRDFNAPSRWNMRIWDDDKKEWLCQSDDDALTYYGFDITGGEITEFQGLPKWHPDRHLIWEQSTGLKDKNGKEIYEGDIVQTNYMNAKGWVVWTDGAWDIALPENSFELFLAEEVGVGCEVVGNIHELPKDFRPEHLKRMGVSISKGGEE